MTTYKELAYLESTGTQYIDTGYSESSTTSEVKFEADVEGLGDVIANTSSYSNGTKIVGINSSNQAFIYYKPTGNRILLTLTQSTEKRTLTAKFSKSSSKMSIGDGFNTSDSSYTGLYDSTSYRMFNRITDTGLPFKGKIYYLKIFDNNSLVRDFIPVLDFNNMPAMYDKVNDVLYYNQGTSQFNYGVKETESSIKLRRKFNMLLASHKKPEYTPLKYLESTGTGTYTSGQYIDTGLDYFADFEITAKQRESAGMKALGTTTYYCIERENATTNAWRFRNGESTFFTTSLLVTDLHTLKWKGGKVYGDGVELGSFAKTSNTGRMYLFAGSVPNDATRINRYPLQISSCRMWNPTTGELVRDYIPVLDKNGTPCMLDRVENKLYYNQGTGDFAYEEWDFTEVDYLESTGTQYIDTLWSPQSNNLRVKFKVKSKGTPRSTAICGAENSRVPRWVFVMFGQAANRTKTFPLIGDWNNGGKGFAAEGFTFTDGTTLEIDWTANATSTTVTDSVSGTTYTHTFDTTITYSNNTTTLKLFQNGDAQKSSIDMYYYQIYDDNTLVRDYVPVVDETNTPALYDKCLNMLFYNAGTGNFEAHFIENGVDYKVVKNIIAEQVATSTSTRACPFISTGIYPSTSKKTRMKAKAQLAVATNSYEHYLGGTNAGSRFVLGQAGGSSGLKFYFGLGTQNYWTTKNVDTDTHIFGLDWATETCSIDDTTWQIPSAGTLEASKPFFINARNTAANANANRPGGGTSYWWKFWNGKKLVYNGIPAVRVSDNKVGLFETVNREFQTTAGTVEYTYTE